MELRSYSQFEMFFFVGLSSGSIDTNTNIKHGCELFTPRVQLMKIFGLRYMFKIATKKLLDQYRHQYDLIQKPLFLNTPIGKITPQQFETFIGKDDVLPFGIYFGYDDIVGNVMLEHTPRLTKKQITELEVCIRLIKDPEGYAKVVAMIQQKPHVKWFLMESLLNKIQLDKLSKTQLVSFKIIFQQLAANGAEYKFLLQRHTQDSVGTICKILLIFSAEATHVSHPQYNLFNLFDDPNIWIKLKLFLQAGVNINQIIDDVFQNTLLHYFLALEFEAGAVRLMDEVEQYHREYPASSTIDYTKADKYGKTPLLMAIGLGLSDFFDALIKKQNIGINQPDRMGRTPSMIAAALGRDKMLSILLGLGVDLSLVDNDGHDIHWYATAPLDQVKEILMQYSVHPDRSLCASGQSYLYSEPQTGIPWVLRHKETGKEQLIVLSGTAEGRHNIAIANALATEQERRFIAMQVARFDRDGADKSIADVCVEQQRAVQVLLRKPSVSRLSIFSNPHDQLVQELALYRVLIESAFFQSIDAKKYNQSIRRISSSPDSKACYVLRILLKYIHSLQIDLNEQAGAEEMSALHYAAKSNAACYDLLIEAGANPELLNKAGMTPSELKMVPLTVTGMK